MIQLDRLLELTVMQAQSQNSTFMQIWLDHPPVNPELSNHGVLTITKDILITMVTPMDIKMGTLTTITVTTEHTATGITITSTIELIII